MANITIVTNKYLAAMVKESRGNPFILEDKIPAFIKPIQIPLKGKINIASICTFQIDEPYNEVIKSAFLLNSEIYIYITGRYHEKELNMIKNIPNNIVFTGFLNDEDYKNLLFSCDLVMDLTLMENCLVCGAYEAISLEKPLILSDTVALREYFSSGAVFTKNNAGEIAKAIKLALNNYNRLQNEVSELKEELLSDWQIKINKLNKILDFGF
jgi:glycosyltransferase involved in cell wall biosynthesis